MTTKKAAKSEMKKIDARLGEIDTAWRSRGVAEGEYEERAALRARRDELAHRLSPTVDQVDSLVR